MKKLYILILFITSIFTITSQSINYDNYLKEGIQPIKEVILGPDFTLKDLNGNDVSLSGYRGKVVLLNFWASWCPPCRSEMPSMETLYKQLQGMDVAILALNLGESKEVAGKFINKEKYTFDVLLDSDNRVGSLYGVRSIPTTYIIDKKGELKGYKLGAFDWDSGGLLNIVKELL